MRTERGNIDYTLYLVTDRALSLGRNTEEVVAAAIKGGVSCVQLREKQLDSRDFIDQARRLKKLLVPLGIPLIINDRVDIAVAADAEGVHLGQSDMHIEDARKLLGTGKLIGISAESVEDAEEAERQGADYIGVSPVYATATKPDTATPLGLEGLRKIHQKVSLPLVAIGGIDSENIGDVIVAGADGIAVVSAIMSAASPEDAARKLMQQIKKARM